MELTVMSHIYNEEYLLPFWLEYHKKIFTNGIIIDYCSTDETCNIIRQICPHWKIIKTINTNVDGSPNFSARLIDDEVIEIEKNISGFKIALNVTEWLLLSNSPKSFTDYLKPNNCYLFQAYQCMSEKINYHPTSAVDFLAEITKVKNSSHFRGVRILHDRNGLDYTLGRHHRIGVDNNVNCDEGIILWTGFYPFNEEILKRKLQIGKNIPQTDVVRRLGFQHMMNREEMISQFKNDIKIMKDINHSSVRVVKKIINNVIEILKTNSNEF